MDCRGKERKRKREDDNTEKKIGTVFNSEVTPAFLQQISPILHVATMVENDSPRVAFLCRYYALQKAQLLDENSIGQGIQQFKENLSQQLKQDDVPSKEARVKKTDVQEIENYLITEYYEKYVKLNMGEKSDSGQLGEAYQVARVLFEVLCADNKSEEVDIIASARNAKPKQLNFSSVRKEALNAAEKAYYNRVRLQLRGKPRIKKAGLFAEITCLRKAVNHRYLLEGLNWKNFESCTKIEILNDRNGFFAKGVVVSVFSDFLKIIQHALEQSNIKCILLGDSMRRDERKAVFKSFKEDPKTIVLLLNCKHGGIVNKPVTASHVFLMEPLLNPEDEEKACDIIMGLQQYKVTKVVRIAIHHTIEDRIIQMRLQKQKKMEVMGKYS